MVSKPYRSRCAGKGLSSNTLIILVFVVLCFAGYTPLAAQEGPPGQRYTIEIPDIQVRSHRGDTLRLFRDVIQGRTLAINFIFTRCGSICPAMGALFAQLESRLAGSAYGLVSLSIDPQTDTPERLETWSARLGRADKWLLLTGEQAAITQVLKAMNVYTAAKEDHAPVVLIIDGSTRQAMRVDAFSPPETIVEMLHSMAQPVHPYFPETVLQDQHERKHRFYSDLMKAKVVLINSFFSACQGSCPLIIAKMHAIQQQLTDYMDSGMVMLSITVDPYNDSPPVLRAYAERHGAGPGWYFLSGKPPDVFHVLARLGLDVEQREQHSDVLLLGNDATGLWKKLNGLADTESLLALVLEVLRDKG